jgi:preprotein translocase subunit YajC
VSVIAPYLLLGQCSENPAECGSAPTPQQQTATREQTATTEGSTQNLPPKPQPSMMPSLMLMVAIIAIFYFVGIRPQKKQADTQKKLQTGLKRGDKVFTNSGILGKVHQVEDNIVTLEIAKNTNIQILKSQINGLQPDASASE